MSWVTVRDAVKALVTSVDNVPTDNVYTRKVMYQGEAEFKTAFWDAARSRYFGIEITRQSIAEQTVNTYFTIRTAHQVNLHLTMGLNDSLNTYNADEAVSVEPGLENVAETLQEKLRTNLTVSGTCENADLPIMGEIVPELRLGKILWGVDINWLVFERTTITESIS